jgi:hypothetical protein
MQLLKKPYKPLMFTGLSGTFNVYGKSFMRLDAVYLSGTPLSNTTFYNPFSAIPKLSAQYPGFNGIKLLSSQYVTNLDNTIIINIPACTQTGYIDIIAQNPAGYGALTQYVIKELYSGTQTLQELRPWSLGVEVISRDIEIEDQMLAITGDDLITIAGDNIVTI